MTRISILAGTALAALMTASAMGDEPGALRLSQIGFEAGGHKRAIVVSLADTTLSWQLVDASGSVLAEGETTPFGADEAAGESVHRIDFSGAAGAGEGHFRATMAGARPGFAQPVSPEPGRYRD